MKIEKESNGTKKQGKTSIKKTAKKDGSTKVITNKKNTNNPETNVSVFTKSTNPKVIIKTEKIENDGNNHLCKNKHKVLKFLLFIIMCIIILSTFFLSLQTYNTINKLAQYIML